LTEKGREDKNGREEKERLQKGRRQGLTPKWWAESALPEMWLLQASLATCLV